MFVSYTKFKIAGKLRLFKIMNDNCMKTQVCQLSDDLIVEALSLNFHI